MSLSKTSAKSLLALATAVLVALWQCGSALAERGDEIDWVDAIRHNRLELIERFLAEGGDPNGAVDYSGTAVHPFYLAVLHKRQDAALALLDAGADFERSDVTIRVLAAEGLDRVLAKVLKHSPSTSILDENALAAASDSGFYDVVNLLLDTGEQRNLNWRDQMSHAVSVALTYGHDDIARLLLERGAPSGGEVMQVAALRSSPGMMRLLLRLGGDPNASLDAGVKSTERTPMDFAWKRYSLPRHAETQNARRIMFELARAGAKLPAKASDTILLDGESELLRERAEKGAAAELMQAASTGYCDVVAELLGGEGAREFEPDVLRQALIAALTTDHDDIARLLLESEAPINRGPLMVAARRSSPGMIRYMLALGADPNEKFADETPVAAAVYSGQVDSTRVLVELLLGGADPCHLEQPDTETHGTLWGVIRAMAPQCGDEW